MPSLSFPFLLLALSLLSKSKRYFWKYSPTPGIDPYIEQVPVNSRDRVAPVFDGEVQYPGSRVGASMVDCTIDENQPVVCLYGGRHDWWSTAELWSYDVANLKWKFRFTGLTDSDLDCQHSPNCRVADLSGAPFPGSRSGFSFVRLSDSRARIFGGRGYAVNSTYSELDEIDEHGALGDVWDLDIASWTWSYVSIAPGSEKWWDYNSSIGGAVSYPCARSLAAVWNLGNDLILQGGTCFPQYCDFSLTWRFYDLDSSWAELGASGDPWNGHGYSVWKSYDDTRLYAFGTDQFYSLFQVYTVSDNSWEVIRYPEDSPIVVTDESQGGGGSRPGGSENRNVFFVPSTLFPTKLNPGLLFLIGGFGYPVGGVDGDNVLLGEMWTFNSEVGESSAWELQQLTDDGSELITPSAENPYTSWDGPNAFPIARYRAAIVYVESARKVLYYGGFVPSPDGAPCDFVDCLGADLWVLDFSLCVGDECLGVLALSAGLLSGAAVSFGIVFFVVFLVVLFCCVKPSGKVLFVFDEDAESTPVSSSGGLQTLSDRKLDFHNALQEEKRLACEAVANLKINRDLFQILMEEIELTKQLAAGGSDSIVYKASWKGRVVCFKVYKTLLLNDQNFSQFEQELEVISGLNHPAIVRFWGCCLTPPRVMEFCCHGEIGQYIMRGEEDECPVPLEERLRFLEEVADGMEFLHSRAVVHRDLKCANILISDDVHAKIIDFGLSRTVSAMYTNLTRKIGTLWYMSPEMTLGKSYTEKTDVYSFAILAFEVAEKNFRPFGDTLKEMVPLRAADDESFRPTFSGDSDKSPNWLQELLVDCWAENPEKRPSFETILKAFQDFAPSEEEEGEEWDSEEEEEEEAGEGDSEEEAEAESG